MKKKYFVLILALAFLCCGAFYIYNYVLYKEVRNIENEKASFKISTSDLTKEYLSNNSEADLKFLSQTIEVKGKVTEVLDSTLTLDNSVFCKMGQAVAPELMNKTVKIKGRCIGFDDLFGVVKMDQCSKQ